MNEQEAKIVRLLLNEMAFEGAMRHFRVPPPELPIELFRELEGIGIPMMYDGAIEDYRYVDVAFDPNRTVFENCNRHLRVIRNNIIHANKSFRPDPPERLSDLLDWSEKFIQAVFDTGSDFAAGAREIKAALKIESF